jgi:hypothetical protein
VSTPHTVAAIPPASAARLARVLPFLLSPSLCTSGCGPIRISGSGFGGRKIDPKDTDLKSTDRHKDNTPSKGGAGTSAQQPASVNTDTTKPTFNDYAKTNQPGKIRAVCAQALLAAAVWLCPPGAAQAQTDLLSLQNSGQQPYTLYSFTLTATNTTTRLTAFFRQDSAHWGVDGVWSTPVSSPGMELAVNGGFETGDFTGWTIVGQQGLFAAGQVAAGTPGATTRDSHSGSFYYFDGAVGGVDGIPQSFGTTIGEDYDLSFWLSNDEGGLSSLDIIAGASVASFNGIPILYNRNAPTNGGAVLVPEPASFALLGFGAFGLACWARSRKTG